MLRTSLYLSNSLHQRLLLLAQQRRRPFSQVVQDLLDTALAETQAANQQQLYQGLKQLQGIGPKSVADTASSIDQVLYGQQGVWKGSGQL